LREERSRSLLPRNKVGKKKAKKKSSWEKKKKEDRAFLLIGKVRREIKRQLQQ